MFRQEVREQATEVLIFIKSMYSANELKIIAAGGVVGSFLSSALGGFDKQLIALCWLSLIDFATGLYAACYQHNCWSAKMFRGFMKKISIFVAVAVAVLLDDVLGVHQFRFATIAGFGLMEALSIIENADRGGWGTFIPLSIRKRLAMLKEQRESKEEPKDNPVKKDV